MEFELCVDCLDYSGMFLLTKLLLAACGDLLVVWLLDQTLQCVHVSRVVSRATNFIFCFFSCSMQLQSSFSLLQVKIAVKVAREPPLVVS